MSEPPGDSRATLLLLDQVRSGEAEAFERLFARHRDYLRHTIEARLDRALRRRLDASDLIQEAHIEALRRLAEYVRNPPVPFRVWLRQIVQDRLLMARRRHVDAARRAVGREAPQHDDPTAAQLAENLLASTSTPSQAASRNEQSRRVRHAIGQLQEQDREILLMRSVEGLSNQEVAFILRIDPNAATKRHGRALLRLRAALVEGELEQS
jgi:RNA polymerase sigma-70 factor (ECF subfamily)